MRSFFDTMHCRSRAHCRTCRNLVGGRDWRRKIAARFAVDGGEDFACPLGAAWGDWPSRGLGDTVEKLIKRVTRGRIKPCGRCRKRRDLLNRLIPYPVAGSP